MLFSTSVCGLTLLVYEVLSYNCMRPLGGHCFVGGGLGGATAALTAYQQALKKALTPSSSSRPLRRPWQLVADMWRRSSGG